MMKDMLTKEQLDLLKEKLIEERKHLNKEIADPHVDFGDDVDAFDEETDEAEEFATKTSANATLAERLADVNDALDKMDVHEYGSCEECHKPIAFEMLKIVPESRLCQNCKKSSR